VSKETFVRAGAVMQLDSPIGPAIFIVFGAEPGAYVDPVHGARIWGLWASHFDKQFENTNGYIYEALLTSDAWVNIAEVSDSTRVADRLK